MVGPYGYNWQFNEHESFKSEYPDYFEEFSDLVFTEDPSTTNYYSSYDYSDYDYYYSGYYSDYSYSYGNYSYSDYYSYSGYYSYSDYSYSSYSDYDSYYYDENYDYSDFYNSTSGTCVDDSTVTDAYGDDCEWYSSNPDSCGAYDDSDFTASEACCACGRDGSSSTSTTGSCVDSDATDDDGDGCDYYTLYSDECGEYDSSNFIASDECCACSTSTSRGIITEYDWYSADLETPVYDTYLMTEDSS